MPESKVDDQSAELYDQENDVYYVTFGTGEPSYCVEVDDVLVLEIGLFSNLPTGYRVLNMSKHEMRQSPIDETKRRMNAVLRALPALALDDREAAVGRSLDRVLA